MVKVVGNMFNRSKESQTNNKKQVNITSKKYNEREIKKGNVTITITKQKKKLTSKYCDWIECV